MRFAIACLILLLAANSQAQRPTPEVKVSVEDRTITWPESETSLAAYVEVNSDTRSVDTTKEGLDFNYRWQQLEGPSRAWIGSPKREATVIGKLEVGTYEFQVEVSYRERVIASDRAFVRVIEKQKPNQPPRADAGPDITIIWPDNKRTIDGIATDSDGSLAVVDWRQLSGADDISVDEDGSLLILSNLRPGRYQFELYVLDDRKEEARDVVTIDVIEQKNEPPSVDAGRERTIVLPKDTVILRGRATDDRGIAAYQWRQVSGPNDATIVRRASLVTGITGLIKGLYQFELTAFDEQQLSDKDIVFITVEADDPPPVNKPPTAIAGRPQSIRLPRDFITLSGDGRDPDGQIVSYFWTQTQGPNSSDISNPDSAQTLVTGLIEGEYVFELFVADNGEKSDRDATRVTVLPFVTPIDSVLDTSNVPPMVNAGPPITITSQDQIVKLRPTFSDPDGEIISVSWAQIDGPTQVLVDSTFQLIPQVPFAENGTYVFELTVIDNDGAQSKDTVSVATNIPNDTTGSTIPLIVVVTAAIGGLGYLAAKKLYPGWFLPGKKVVAYYLDKTEEAFVDKILPNAEKTKSYSVSKCNSSDIKKLTEQNIAVHLLNTSHLVVNTPGRIQTYDFSKKKDGVKRSVSKHPGSNMQNTMVNLISEDQGHQSLPGFAEFPCFYTITLDGPLLEDYKNRLQEQGIQLIQRVPVNSYIVRLANADQLQALNAAPFRFIRMKQRYSAQDTGIIVRNSNFQHALHANHDIILDLLLHREEDMGDVVQYLQQLHIEIIDSYRNRIRISISAASLLHIKLAQHPYIQAIYEYIPPVWNNDVSRQLIHIDKEVAGQSILAQTGAGEIIGVADTGIDKNHPDLKNQLIEAIAWGRKESNDTADPHGHGTHVAGTIAGNGTASGGKIKGMAPGAKLIFQSLLAEDNSLGGLGLRLEDLFREAYEKGVRIHNNSWGSATEGRYTMLTEAVDNFIYQHPEMLIVFSAGNEGCNNGDSDDEKGYVGYNSIGSPATTKNGLAVGASRTKRTDGGYASKTYGAIYKEKFPFPPTSTELISGDPEAIAAYSSRGSCDDFRMKPDIVAPGTDILSTRSGDTALEDFHGGYAQFNDAYAFLGGTSMAAPIVAGAAALVRQYYKQDRNCKNPSAALVKATLINGTRKLTAASAIHGGDDIPNENQGFGMLDLLYTIPNSENQFLLNFHDSLSDPRAILRAQDQVFKSDVTLTATSWIRVCLAFTEDPERSTQNDLNLMLEYGVTKEKWTGNRGLVGKDVKRKKTDQTNNLEIIRLEAAQPGLYTVNVIAYSLMVAEQGFALVITTGDTGAKFG